MWSQSPRVPVCNLSTKSSTTGSELLMSALVQWGFLSHPSHRARIPSRWEHHIKHPHKAWPELAAALLSSQLFHTLSQKSSNYFWWVWFQEKIKLLRKTFALTSMFFHAVPGLKLGNFKRGKWFPLRPSYLQHHFSLSTLPCRQESSLLKTIIHLHLAFSSDLLHPLRNKVQEMTSVHLAKLHSPPPTTCLLPRCISLCAQWPAQMSCVDIISSSFPHNFL